MPRKHSNLASEIFGFQSLLGAANKAAKGKRHKPGVAAFLCNLETELLRLERDLSNRSYRPGRYNVINIRDPKPRRVSAAPFRDRVVHHALCAVIEPIFERGFIFDSYANRSGKGTHRAVSRYEKFRDRYGHVLRCDIFRYFPAIDHEILKSDVRRRIACEDTLWLVETIIDGSNMQEPVNVYFPDDDLFTPNIRRRGLPIGNLTSQFFANIYLDGLDHFCKEVLGAKGYVRYVDDFALFHDDPKVLKRWREQVSIFLEGRRLRLHPQKTTVLPSACPKEFLGYVLSFDGRRLPELNVRRFRNRLRGLRDQYKAGRVELDVVDRHVRAWIAHAENADTWRLRHSIFKGGIFDPALDPPFRDGPRGPKRKPARSPVVPASFAAALGTTIQGTSAPLTATGTTLTTGTTTTGSVSPAHLNSKTICSKEPMAVSRGVQERS